MFKAEGLQVLQFAGSDLLPQFAGPHLLSAIFLHFPGWVRGKPANIEKEITKEKLRIKWPINFFCFALAAFQSVVLPLATLPVMFEIRE